MANIYNSVECPQCDSHDFIKKGLTKNSEKINLMCKECGKRFSVPVDATLTRPQSEVDAEIASRRPAARAAVKAAPKAAPKAAVKAPIFTLYSEDGTLIHQTFKSKEEISKYCADKGFECQAVNDTTYKAISRRTHVKG